MNSLVHSDLCRSASFSCLVGKKKTKIKKNNLNVGTHTAVFFNYRCGVIVRLHEYK